MDLYGSLGWQLESFCSQVVLSDLTIDLEVRAVVRSPPETEESEQSGATEEIVLQRPERGPSSGEVCFFFWP